ncbi:hypothetical protein J3458_004236 [Metarhizium acridum]|uniref:uncharacterized protein n=1 Tax=Metarhizium acridum TaxID=92637 RepID=UPI001C6B08DA|nr:hypothetical protein J3458_004236 [Metarhizium acridum]
MWSRIVKIFCPAAADAGDNAVGMIVLQILRLCTVVTLATMGVAYWVFILNVEKSRAYFAFECASLFFNSIICFILLLSEFPVLKSIKGYFLSSWPVLSDMHGVAWLGGIMLLLGCNIFGNLNRPAQDAEKLAPPLVKLTLAAGVLAFIFGVLNIVCSFVWRNGKQGITSRDVRANGALARGRRHSLPDYASGSMSGCEKQDAKTVASSYWDKATNMVKKKGSARPAISGPVVDVESGLGEKARFSPVAPGIQRPDTAMHPINLNTNSGSSSRYSDPDLNRF